MGRNSFVQFHVVVGIDGLPVYQMGGSADVEEIEFFSDSGEES